jgi:rhamnogalacturonyl hydrolase YesR
VTPIFYDFVVMKKSILISFIFLSVIFSFISFRLVSQPLKWDNTQAMIKAMEWQEQHPIYALAPTDWTNGAYYIGVTKAFQATQDQMYLAAIKTMGYRNEWKPFRRKYHADDIAISYPYLFISTTRSDLVDLEPTKSWIDAHLFEPNEWKDGKNSQKNILWWWCDALFMAPPVITYYSVLTDEKNYLDAMHNYYVETYELLFDKEEKLFARDLSYVWKGETDDVREPNGKKVFWSRGNGWVLGGLALILDNMPTDYKHRLFYEDLFKTMAGRILELQPEDGLWRTSLLAPEWYDHGEVSGSGFFTFAMAWGINNGLLERQTYQPAVIKAWNALRNCQHENGMIGWVQNIGAEPSPANKDSWQNYGTGAFLLAGSEIIKLNQ